MREDGVKVDAKKDIIMKMVEWLLITRYLFDGITLFQINLKMNDEILTSFIVACKLCRKKRG